MGIKLKKDNFKHYFTSVEHSEKDYFTFTTNVLGKSFSFTSCPDVFSKSELDFGSLTLIKSVVERKEIFSGKILDMCCGYGTIGVVLYAFIQAEYTLSDINSTAVKLAQINAKNNGTNISNVLVSDMFDNIKDNYNHIVSNPPIKTGKQVLLKFLDGAENHLLSGGTLTIVIKKNLGADSTKKYMEKLFGNCEVWEREKGYYILHSIKK